MSVDNILVLPRSRMWAALTDHQRAEAARLTLSVVSAAMAGSAAGVASALAEAGRLSARTEEHVVWAAGRLVGDLRLLVDPAGRASRFLIEGKIARDAQRANDGAGVEELF